MAIDLTDSKAGIVTKSGSFWYRILAEENKPTAQHLGHMTFYMRAYRQLRNAMEMTLSGGYFPDNYKVIRFQPDQVLYYGADQALQRRYSGAHRTLRTSNRAANLEILNVSLGITEQDEALAEGSLPLLLPNPNEDLTLPATYQMSYGLILEDDIYINTILCEDGKMLYQNLDFRARYGMLFFKENPEALFPKLKFTAFSFIEREPNILNYPFQVEVHGPIDRIAEYYRVVQTPRTLYYAAAQAGGFPVVRKDCVVEAVLPLHSGYSYVTDDLRYDAPFAHEALTVGTRLEKNEIIGAKDLFFMVCPGEPVPNKVRAISMDYALPVKGLSAPASEIQLYKGELFQPAFDGTPIKLARYWKYLKEINPDKSEEGEVKTGNGLQFVLRKMVPNRWVIAAFADDAIPSEMKLKILRFLTRERPLGSVLFTASF